MALKQVAWNVNTKVALIQNDGAALPSGSVKAGTFDHKDSDDHLGPQGLTHVLYHHVQEVMYHIGWYDMEQVSIQLA